MSLPFDLPEELLSLLPMPDPAPRVWVVGGAVRDHLLGHPYHDLDLVVVSDAIQLGKDIADAIGWDFYILDQGRGTARLLSKDGYAGLKRIDCSVLQGGSIEADLRRRDFTINALGLNPFDASNLIDPTGGFQDLQDKQLRACGDSSMVDDPVRVIRAVRFSTSLDLEIKPGTIGLIKDAGGGLASISAERVRDEFFQILLGPDRHASLQLLVHLGILPRIFEAFDRRSVERWSLEDVAGATTTALARIREFDKCVKILQPKHDPEAAADAIWGSVALKLGRFRIPFSDYSEGELTDGRNRMSLLALALLLLSIDSAATSSGISHGRSNDDTAGGSAGISSIPEMARRMRLSRQECQFLSSVIRASKALVQMSFSDGLSPIDVHRYFRSNNEAGVGAVVIFLVSVLAERAGPPDSDRWERCLDISREIWGAYYERFKEVVDPTPLLNGEILISELGVEPGPELGELLRRLVEAQVAGEILDLDSALEYARVQYGG